MARSPWSDGNFANVKAPKGVQVGVQCPSCELLFIVFALNPDNEAEIKSIPIDGSVDYFCPCCGVNLREYMRLDRAESAGPGDKGDAVNGPLVNAPSGYVWSWRGQGLAHLVEFIDHFRGLRLTRCGKRVRGKGRTVAFQVGGYSQAPCEDCLKAAHLLDGKERP